jgi:diguanylate cyclase (GGDEF)-like protein
MAENPEGISPQQFQNSISQLLNETEKIGTSNPDKYSINLTKLKKNHSKFNAFQKDFYDYLIYYKLGYTGNFKESLENFQKLFKRTEFIEIKYRAQYKIANIHIISGNIIEALNAIDYVLNNINKIDDDFLKKEGYKMAAGIYFLIEDYGLSRDFSNLILNNSTNGNDLCKALTINSRIQLKLAKQTTQELTQDIKNSIYSCESIGDYVFSNILKLDWFKFQLDSPTANIEDYQGVLDELKLSDDEINNTKYKNLINIKSALFAKAYWKLGEQDYAINYALNTLNESQSIGNTWQKIEALQILIEYYQNINDFKLALYYSTEKNNAEKKHYNKQQTNLMAYQTIKHDSLAKSHEIELLSQQNQLLSLEQNLANKSALNQRLVILFLALLAVLILYWGFRTKKTQGIYKKLSEIDDLTKIYNRKGMKDYMESLLNESENNKTCIAYCIFDLDHFKNINDQYGHITGDWVIKTVIAQCRIITHNKATLGRIGGEEFAIVMKNADSKKLAELAEKCRKKIIQIDSSASGHQFYVSASFGVTDSSNSGYVYTKLMTYADKAMYTAKVAGRNMVVDYSENY